MLEGDAALADEHRCGAVAILGLVNAGKSTLINALVGNKVSICTPKANTTRKATVGICQDIHYQMVLNDLPGINSKQDIFANILRRTTGIATHGADVILVVVDPTSLSELEPLVKMCQRHRSTPLVIALNKIDCFANKSTLLPHFSRLADLFGEVAIFPVSARRRQGLLALQQNLVKLLPVAPKQFAPDLYTDRSERFLCNELVFEQMLLQLQQEIPHNTAVQIVHFHDLRQQKPPCCRIQAEILVIKPQHKAIVIGHKGQRLRLLGSKARMQMAKLLGCQVHLELYVRLVPHWRENRTLLSELGFAPTRLLA